MRQVCIWSSKVKSENRRSRWKRAGQSTFLHLDYLETDVNFAVTEMFLSSLWQELSEFSEGPDTIWTVLGGEFDQVRWSSSKGAADLATLHL